MLGNIFDRQFKYKVKTEVAVSGLNGNNQRWDKKTYFKTKEEAELYISECVKECMQHGYSGCYTKGKTTYIDNQCDYIAFTRLWR